MWEANIYSLLVMLTIGINLSFMDDGRALCIASLETSLLFSAAGVFEVDVFPERLVRELIYLHNTV